MVDPKHTVNRRAVLSALSSTSAGAVAAAVLPSNEAKGYDPGPSETHSRYRETDHVRAFYRTNGYETLHK
jgi:hypothetical protein